MAQLEFDCGEIAESVGMMGLAIKAHLFHHATDTLQQLDCIKDCKAALATHSNSYTEAN